MRNVDSKSRVILLTHPDIGVHAAHPSTSHRLDSLSDQRSDCLIMLNKTFLIVVGFFFTTSTLALAIERDTQMVGTGRAMGMCHADTFSACSTSLSEQAKDSARRDAAIKCEGAGGSLPASLLYCSSRCNPMFAPPQPNPMPVFTTCEASCNGSCQMPGQFE